MDIENEKLINIKAVNGNLFNKEYLPRRDEVFAIMFVEKELCEMTIKTVTNQDIEINEVTSQARNDFRSLYCGESIFDVLTHSKDGRIISLDIQRSYSKCVIRNRTVYYACRLVGSQTVHKCQYDKLQNVIVMFILTEATPLHTSSNKEICLIDKNTNEKYCDLLTIHEVGIRSINNNCNENMQILKAFFSITSLEEYNSFIIKYSNSEYGKLLLKYYNIAISTDYIQKLSREGKFMLRLSEEERLEEREFGRQEGRLEATIDNIKKMVNIFNDFNIPKEQIKNKIIQQFNITNEQYEDIIKS